jgi:LysR family glycine cleavage system transcriptional activator
MASNLPPLNSLHSFIVAAKHKSFTKAAAELHLTQGAISKQIKMLEDYLGAPLFKRKHQSLELTKAAEKYRVGIDFALNDIRQITAKTRKKQSEEININILPSLGSQWFIDRLESFKDKHPRYKLHLSISNHYTEIDKENNADFYIRIARKNIWKEFSAEMLMKEKMICICSPEFMAKNKIENIADLLRCSLLQHSSRPAAWRDFFKASKVKSSNINFTSSYQHFFMLIKAARNGYGVALVPEFLVKEELKKKELVAISKSKFSSGYNYYLLHSKQVRKSNFPVAELVEACLKSI